MISRSEPSQELVRFRANGMMEVIGWETIRFKQEETAGIVRLHGLHREIAQDLHKITDGWAAGLTLLLERAKTSDIDISMKGIFDSTIIFDYFASEIFNTLANHIQQFRR
jgi:ATP/maltotriose-dependent transcriptional regulator MalT